MMNAGSERHQAHVRYWSPLARLLSRRRFISSALAAGASLSALGLLAACNGDDDDVVDPGTDPAAGDDEPVSADDDADMPEGDPVQGGQLRIATRASADMLEPHLRFTIEDAMINLHVYSGLVRANVDLEPDPELAESWESNDAGDEWTFQIREGVRFHNGRDFDASDVADSFNRLLDPETGSAFSVQLDMIEEIEAPDETTAIFHLNRPYGGFPELLSNDFSSIVPVELGDDLHQNPVGTGGYRVDSFVPGERTVLVRNDDYWNTENPPHIDEIHFIVMTEETTRMTALQGGDIDLIVDIAASSVPIVEATDTIMFEEVVTGSHLTVNMTTDQEPWDDPRVRTALKLSLNRDEILQAALQGFGVTAADQPIPPIDPMYPDLPIPEQDIDRARELLEEAGYADGIDLELHTSPGRVGMQEVGLAVQEMAGAAGFRIEIQSHPIDQFWADIWMQVPFFVGNWNMRLPADQMLQVAHSSGSAWNESLWDNTEFDELVREAQAQADPDERREVLREACEILSEEGGAAIPVFRSGIDAWSTRVQNYQPHPMRWINLYDVWLNG